MLQIDQPLNLVLSVGELNIVLTALAEVPFRLSAPVIDRLRQQVLAIDSEAFSAPSAGLNGSAVPAPQPD